MIAPRGNTPRAPRWASEGVTPLLRVMAAALCVSLTSPTALPTTALFHPPLRGFWMKRGRYRRFPGKSGCKRRVVGAPGVPRAPGAPGTPRTSRAPGQTRRLGTLPCHGFRGSLPSLRLPPRRARASRLPPRRARAGRARAMTGREVCAKIGSKTRRAC